ncbi:endonuclease VII domain-containing protein [Streptomyces rubiginosohelvolus]|uniref:endonuclease VII domain-containing protein n=1 Tax=Streptomyces rubiginosohelvolus TaxID=67362 RepID=UPI0036550462
MSETELQTCTQCNQPLPKPEFHRSDRGGRFRKCRSCRAATRKAWRETYRDKQSVYRRRFKLSRYGLTESEYDFMLAAQGGVCAMCGETCVSGRQLAVDHDHATGVVRGLLCVKCNRQLGIFEVLRPAAEEYLSDYGAGNPHISHGEALRKQRDAPRPRRSAATSKLTEGDVAQMRARYAAGGVTQRGLAAEYGVSQNAVGLILRRATWDHVA